jgi:hypothetical protein
MTYKVVVRWQQMPYALFFKSKWPITHLKFNNSGAMLPVFWLQRALMFRQHAAAGSHLQFLMKKGNVYLHQLQRQF